MHAIKSGWVGQTFALAKCNDSGGRKSRIRRSKEERKAMVESFINKYQKSNNGNFPSLNLTHKEVCGSFYTVREIVREVIQENRVLGPAKLTPEEASRFLEQYPLGSISIEPQTHFSSTNEAHVITHVTPDRHQSKSEEHILNSSGYFPGPEHHRFDDGKLGNGSREAVEKDEESDEPVITRVMPNHDQGISEEQVLNSGVKFSELEHQMFDNALIVNGSSEAIEKDGESDEPVITHVMPNHHQGISEEQVLNSGVKFSEPDHQMFDNALILNGSNGAVEENKISDEPLYAELPVRESLDREKNGAKELETSKIRITRLTADVVVETFPPRPVSQPLDGKSSEQSDSTETLEEKEVESVELEAGNNNFVLDSFSEISSGLVDEKAETNLANPLSESNDALMNEKVISNLADHSLEILNRSTTKNSVVFDINDGIDHEAKDALNAGVKPMNASNGILVENFNSMKTSDLHGQSISEDAGAIKQKPEGSSQKESNLTLNRINLESWEGTSKKSAGSQTNPLLALFKSFIAAFVKFWSE